MATFNLQIVTPDKLFYNEDVDMLVVRTTEGDVGILKGHIDYVPSLDIGIIKIKKDGVFKEATIAGGFIQVDKEKYAKISTKVIHKDADILFFPGCNVYYQPDKLLA